MYQSSRNYLFSLVLSLLSTFIPFNLTSVSPSVTYETTQSRFGDNLISYFHAKWISYKYNIPLLYKPFIYSDQLQMHVKEKRYSEKDAKAFDKMITLGRNNSVDINSLFSTLYLSPYFPESKWELKNCLNYSGGPWDYFEIDWSDPGFKKALQETVSPLHFKPHFPLPVDRISVAVHVRRGGGFDDANVRKCFPLKFLPDSFFISQIKNIYNLLDQTPLYVYIFTDDPRPERLMQMYQRKLPNMDIQWDCRKSKNNEYTNVLEDFFALTQFDCLIHSESNYSLCASKISDYLISIYADSFKMVNNKVVIDHIKVTKKFE